MASDRAPLQVGVAELPALQCCHQLPRLQARVDRRKPGVRQRPRVLRSEVARGAAVAQLALADHALGDPQHRLGVGSLAPLGPERPDRQHDRGVSPLCGAPLRAMGLRPPGADMGEELRGRGGSRRLCEGAPDVDARVVV
jgi:hypothetical protein